MIINSYFYRVEILLYIGIMFRQFKPSEELTKYLFCSTRAKKRHHMSGVFFFHIAGIRLRRVVDDAIADLWFSEEVEVEMSEQSLFRRSAPYKPYLRAKKYGSLSNVGVRIIKFHNTIFSDIKICLLAEA